MMKRGICLLLVALLVAMAFSACGQSGQTTSTASTSTGTTASTATSQPATDNAGNDGDITTITYFRPHLNRNNITYYSDALWIQELENRMNVKFDFTGPLVTGNDYTQAVNILLASNDLPDLVFHNWNNYNGGLAAAISDGVVVDFGANEEYRAMLPTWFGMLENNDMMRKAVTLDDGTSVVFCHVEQDLKRAAYMGYSIRQDWLDNVGLSAPTTIDQLHEALVAFKDQDANGNGDLSDEIPMSDDKDLNTIKSLMAAWGLRYNTPYPAPDTGKLTYWTSYKNGEAFTEFITEMNKWYNEGLIDADFSSQDGSAKDAKVTSNRVGFIFTWPGNYVSWRDALETSDPSLVGNVKFAGLVQLVGPAGKPYGVNDAHVRYAASNEGTCITPKAESEGKMEAILKTIDYMYSDEGSQLINWGVEGVSYDVVDGKNVWTETLTNDSEYSFSDKVFEFALPTWGGWPKQMKYDAWASIEAADPHSLEAHENYWKADTGILMPPLMMSRDEADQYNQIMTDANTAIGEFFTNAIIGTRPLSDIPVLLDQLNSMGVDRAMEIYQNVYDRYTSK